jgi:hypothetical protein
MGILGILEQPRADKFAALDAMPLESDDDVQAMLDVASLIAWTPMGKPQ